MWGAGVRICLILGVAAWCLFIWHGAFRGFVEEHSHDPPWAVRELQRIDGRLKSLQRRLAKLESPLPEPGSAPTKQALGRQCNLTLGPVVGDIGGDNRALWGLELIDKGYSNLDGKIQEEEETFVDTFANQTGDAAAAAMPTSVPSPEEKGWSDGVNSLRNSLSQRSGKGCRESTYGEVTSEGAEGLLSHPTMALRPNDVFMDLGAGLGKFTVQAALANASEAVGVELSGTRWEKSCKALERVREGLGRGCGSACRARRKRPVRIELLHNDALAVNVTRATIIYLASLCFQPELLLRFLHKLCAEAPVGARIASLRPLKGDRGGPLVSEGDRFVCGGGRAVRVAAYLRIMMSWGIANSVYVYHVERE